jgi:hypothetical protein
MSTAHDSERATRVIVLPEARPEPSGRLQRAGGSGAATADAADVLYEEFGALLPRDVVERVAAAARHAIERSGSTVSADAVCRLARGRLLARLSTAQH